VISSINGHRLPRTGPIRQQSSGIRRTRFFFTRGDCNKPQYSLCEWRRLLLEGWPRWIDLVDLLRSQTVYQQHPFHYWLGSVYVNFTERDKRVTTKPNRRRFRIDTEVRCVGAHPPFGPLSRRRLNPIKPVYDPDRPDGRLNLTASAFNQRGQ